MIRNLGGSERGEGADVAEVLFGSNVDAYGFEAKGQFVLEVGEGHGGIGWEGEWRADDDLDAAAEGGGSVVGDAEGEDSQGKVALAGVAGNTRGAALEG